MAHPNCGRFASRGFASTAHRIRRNVAQSCNTGGSFLADYPPRAVRAAPPPESETISHCEVDKGLAPLGLSIILVSRKYLLNVLVAEFAREPADGSGRLGTAPSARKNPRITNGLRRCGRGGRLPSLFTDCEVCEGVGVDNEKRAAKGK